MGERLNLESIVGKNHDIEINEKDTQDLSEIAGGSERKQIHSADLISQSGNSKKKISLVEREYTQSFQNTWQAFKDAGLPVVPNFYKTPRGTMMVPDLTADGSNLFGKAANERLGFCLELKEFGGKDNYEISKQRNLKKLKLIDLFLTIIDGPELDRIKQQLQTYKEIADSNELTLADDDAFELRIHPNGSWDLVCLDLTRARTKQTNFSSKESLHKLNQESVDHFLKELQGIKERYLEIKTE